MSSQEKAAGSFIKGATVLTAAGIASRLLGLFFKVPLFYMYGSYGNGIFYNVTNIYNFLLMVSTVGLPVGISKMISENLARKDYVAVYDSFKIARITLIVIGGVSTALLLFGAQAIINLTGWPQDSYWSIIAIAPAPLIVSICCAYRGFFQGFQLMNPTAISQILEQIFRVIVGLAVCYYGVYILGNVGIGVAGSVFGATFGALIALLTLLLTYWLFKSVKKGFFRRAETGVRHKSYKSLFFRLVEIAVPVTLTSSIVSLFSVIDSAIYIPRLAAAGITPELATEMIGDFGNAELLINVPLVISGNLAVAFMPSISESFALKDRKLINQQINLAVQVLLLVGLPCCVGLSVLSSGISDLLFPNSNCGYYLFGYAYVTLFMMLSNTFQSILQGIDRFFIPLITLGMAAIIRFVSAYILLAVPGLDLYGIISAGFITFLFLTVSNYYFVKKYSGFKLNWKRVLGFVFSSAVMGLLVWGCFFVLIKFLPNVISVFVSVIVGVLIYFVMVVLTGSLTEELIVTLPGASKLEPLYLKLKHALRG